ncbi:MAG: phosphoglycerate kinase [bacterium]|nr:phosphoglycerate kinase [bacterium]
MAIKTISDISVRNKLVLYRAAYDVPLRKHGSSYLVHDDSRIVATLPTIRKLLRENCRIVILTWAGRPKGKKVASLRTDPIARRLSKLLRHPVRKLDDCVGGQVEKEVKRLKPREIVVLENVRFHFEEDQKDPRFIRQLSRLGEVWVFDAFAQAHRDVASIVGPPRFLPSVAGLLLEKELSTLGRLLKNPRRPFVAILGGAKIATRAKLIANLKLKADRILLGGALANTVLLSKGQPVGDSLVEPAMVLTIRKLKLKEPRVLWPRDVVVGQSLKSRSGTIRITQAVKDDDIILDVGPGTIKDFTAVVRAAKTIVWNGPMGYFENPAFRHGTMALAKAVGHSRAEVIIGGGDTEDALSETNMLKKVDFVSTGGGAMLHYLAGEKLPGILALDSKKK